MRDPNLPVASAPGVPFANLAAAVPGEPLAEEWNLYRREAGRLLAEGYGGKFILIQGVKIAGLFETFEAARAEGLRRWLREPFLVHCIRAEEPHLRVRGVNFPWPS